MGAETAVGSARWARQMVQRTLQGTRRAMWGFADQALSSLTNFVLAVAVARSTTTEGFGVFSLAFATYLVALSLSRAVSTEPLSVRYSSVSASTWRRGTRHATGTALVAGVVAGAACLAAGLVAGGTAGATLVALGLGMPLLLLQDAWRFAFFAVRRGGSAFANDLVWAGALGVGLLFLIGQGTAEVPAFVAVWAIGAGVGAALGLVQSGVLPDPRQVLAWRREHADIAPRFAAEALVVSGAQYLAVTGIGVVAGLVVLGTVRAGHTLMNAVHIATYGIQLFAVPEGVRIRERSHRALLRFCAMLSGLLAGVCLAWGVFLLLLPESVGRALLADTWLEARTVILPLSISMAAGGVQAGAFVGLRALASAQRSLKARISSSGLLLLGGIGGAIVGGAVGAAWGMAIGASIGAASWWSFLLRGARESQDGSNP
jgi:O-antigen/teichoic acid export membrane protein